MNSARSDTPLRSAVHGWARVVSTPEPGLALLDAGKRDVPFDERLPIPQNVAHAEVTALDDQHAFLRMPENSAPLSVAEPSYAWVFHIRARHSTHGDSSL